MKEMYQFKPSKNGNATDILIYGDIKKAGLWEKVYAKNNGVDLDNVAALDFATALSEVETDDINVHINSYGGSVSEGLAIYNLLKSCGKNVTTYCDGFACSSASVIFCAGKKRVMPSTSLLLIHNASTYAGSGNAAVLRKIADDLDKVTQPSVEAYRLVSNLSEQEIKNLMDAETWITAEEALKWGFATESADPEDNYEQSLDNGYISNMVFKLKSMENTIFEMKKNEKPDVNGWVKFFGGN